MPNNGEMNLEGEATLESYAIQRVAVNHIHLLGRDFFLTAYLQGYLNNETHSQRQLPGQASDDCERK